MTRAAKTAAAEPVFHVNDETDQAVIAAGIGRNIALLVRRRAARKGWETRKRMAERRAALAAAEADEPT